LLQQLSDEIDLRDRAVNCRKKILKNSLHRLPSTTTKKKGKTPLKSRKSPKTIGRKTPSFDDEGNENDENKNELMDVEQPEMWIEETVPVETVVKKDLRTTDEFQFLQIYNTMNYRSFLNEDEQVCEEKATNDLISRNGSDSEQNMVFSLILSNMFEFLSEMAISNEELQEFQRQLPPQDSSRQKSSTSTLPAFPSSSTSSTSLFSQQQPTSSSPQFKEWQCSSCTFYNKKKINSNAMNMITLLCDMCGTPFPSSVSSGSTIVRSPSSLEKKWTTTTPAIGDIKKENSSSSTLTPTTVMTPWTTKKATIPSASITTTTKGANKSEVIELLDSSDEELEKTEIVAVEKELEVIMIEEETQKPLSLIEQPIQENLNNDNNKKINNHLSSTSASLVAGKKDFLSSLHFDDWKIHSFIQQYLFPYQANEQEYSISSSSTIKMDLSLTLSNYNVKEREENNLLQDCLKFFLPVTSASTTTTYLTANESNTSSSLVNTIVLKSFYVHGKRFGDPTINKGKSVFCGQDDSFLNVEQFVMQKCLLIDPDEIERLESALVLPLSVSLPVSRNSGPMNVTPSAKKKNSNNGKKTAGSGSGSGKKRKRKTIEDEGGEVDEIELLLNEYKDIDDQPGDEIISPSKPMEENNNHDDFLEMKNFTIVPYTEIVQECGGWDGWHCEGAILRILFGIFMFPVMYSNQQNMFLTPYQDSPLDFPYPSFYSLR
jgi:hypothetical protein